MVTVRFFYFMHFPAHFWICIIFMNHFFVILKLLLKSNDLKKTKDWVKPPKLNCQQIICQFVKCLFIVLADWEARATWDEACCSIHLQESRKMEAVDCIIQKGQGIQRCNGNRFTIWGSWACWRVASLFHWAGTAIILHNTYYLFFSKILPDINNVFCLTFRERKNALLLACLCAMI